MTRAIMRNIIDGINNHYYETRIECVNYACFFCQGNGLDSVPMVVIDEINRLYDNGLLKK